MNKKILCVLLALCMVLGNIPAAAFAAGYGNDKTIMPGTSGIEGQFKYYNGVDHFYRPQDYIYFGQYDNSPVKWRVLDTKTNMGTKGLFLLSEYQLAYKGPGKGICFDNVRYPMNNTWDGSGVQLWCRSFAGQEEKSSQITDPGFSEKEQTALINTTKEDPAVSLFKDGYREDMKWAAMNFTDEKVFLLSIEEVYMHIAENSTSSELAAKVSDGRAQSAMWWLRTPVDNNSHQQAGLIRDVLGIGFVDAVSEAMRPATNLDTDKILFTSAATDGKAGDKTLSPVEKYTGKEWKVTLRDDMRNFNVTETSLKGATGKNITFNYTGAVTGENEYISVILADEYGEYMYYGRIKSSDAESGSCTMSLPFDMEGGNYTLKVFNEQYNGDKKTDYASDFQNISLEVEKTPPVVTEAEVTFRVENGTWDGEDSTDKIVKVTLYDGMGTLNASDVPQGMKASTGFEGGAWDMTPDTAEKEVRGNVTYTYTFTPIPGFGPSMELMTGISGVKKPLEKEGTVPNEENTYSYFEPQTYIYFGTDNGVPIKWRVLDTNTSTGEEGLFLLTEHVMNKKTKFADWFNPWNGSTAQKWCTDFVNGSESSGIPPAFSNEEKEMILKTTKSDPSGTSMGWSWGSVSITDQEMFFLSAQEVEQYIASYRKLPALNATKEGENVVQDWWLRSPNRTSNERVGVVQEAWLTHSDVSYSKYARPAINIDSSDVLFMTPAQVDGAALAKTGEYEGNEWKLTLKGENNGFEVKETEITGKPDKDITFNYINGYGGNTAVVGVIITDNSGIPLYHGYLAGQEQGSCSFTLPEDIESGNYKMQIFSQNKNQNKSTSVATNIEEVALKILPKHAHTGELVNGQDATCDKGGWKDYYKCSCGKVFEDESCTTEIADLEAWKLKGGNGYIGPTGHDFKEPVYKWSADNKTCYAERVCRNDSAHIETAAAKITSKVTTPATCTEIGETTYTATFEKTWAAEQTKTIADIPATGHKWDKTSYEWSSDGKACTAKRVCKNDSKHIETATAKITSKLTTPATCTEIGETTYTATFEKTWAAEQTKTIADIPATGHKWDKTTYEWSSDGKACTAKRVCKNDSEHVEKTEGTVTCKVVKEAGCTEKGSREYTAVFGESWAEKQVKTVEDIAATGHNLQHVSKKEATEEETGYEEYWKCILCDKLFMDEHGINEISEPVIINRLTHVHKPEEIKGVDPTNGKDGHRPYYSCYCGKFFEDIACKTEIKNVKEWKEKGGKLPKLGYYMISGENGLWVQNTDGTLTFKTNGDFRNFRGISVDGKEVSEENYLAKSGSTIVTLSNAYLAQLNEGEHTIEFRYTDGSCSTKFTVKNDEEKENAAVKTGDESELMIWMLTMTAVMLILAIVYKKKYVKDSIKNDKK